MNMVHIHIIIVTISLLMWFMTLNLIVVLIGDLPHALYTICAVLLSTLNKISTTVKASFEFLILSMQQPWVIFAVGRLMYLLISLRQASLTLLEAGLCSAMSMLYLLIVLRALGVVVLDCYPLPLCASMGPLVVLLVVPDMLFIALFLCHD